MRTRTVLIAMLTALPLVPGGCLSRIAKEGLGGVTGGKGMARPLREVPDAAARPLGQYERFELGRIADDMEGRTPGQLLSLLPGEFDKQLTAKKIPNAPGGKTLLVRGKVIHYEESGTFGQLFGPLEEVVARIELVDKDSGAVLGVANCVGRTQESVNMGIHTKAEGLAKAIVGWIDRLYPEDKRIKEE